jgi:hypothetical protein
MSLFKNITFKSRFDKQERMFLIKMAAKSAYAGRDPPKPSEHTCVACMWRWRREAGLKQCRTWSSPDSSQFRPCGYFPSAALQSAVNRIKLGLIVQCTSKQAHHFNLWYQVRYCCLQNYKPDSTLEWEATCCKWLWSADPMTGIRSSASRNVSARFEICRQGSHTIKTDEQEWPFASCSSPWKTHWQHAECLTKSWKPWRKTITLKLQKTIHDANDGSHFSSPMCLSSMMQSSHASCDHKYLSTAHAKSDIWRMTQTRPTAFDAFVARFATDTGKEGWSHAMHLQAVASKQKSNAQLRGYLFCTIWCDSWQL